MITEIYEKLLETLNTSRRMSQAGLDTARVPKRGDRVIKVADVESSEEGAPLEKKTGVVVRGTGFANPSKVKVKWADGSTTMERDEDLGIVR